MKLIEFLIPGAPVAKGRPRFRIVGRHVVTYTPKQTKEAERAALDAFEDKYPEFKTPLEGPIRLTVKFLMPVPMSLSKRKKLALYGRPHTKKPDTDNLVKAICDALNGRVFKDDSQIFSIHCEKFYTDNDPYTHVVIEEEKKA